MKILLEFSFKWLRDNSLSKSENFKAGNDESEQQCEI